MMDINSGFKAVDKLVKTHGVSCEHTDNPFQRTVDIPDRTRPCQLRYLIQPFGLNAFPHAMWLAIHAHMAENSGMSVHRFTLPHLNKVICWVLVNDQGKVLEKAYPLNKPQYIQAARVLIGTLLGRLSCSPRPLQMSFTAP
ncbi:MAG: hypothetical protein ACI8WB_003400 [Phenylobacterium sp.]|jgi:hypothetical protein